MLTSEVVLAKLKVDSSGRVFLPKDCRAILGICAEDEIALTLEGESNCLLLKVQKSAKVVKIWRMVEEKSF